MALSDRIKRDIQEKTQQKYNNIQYFREQILITDALKEDYDRAAVTIDTDITNDLDTVNNTLVGVQSAYQARIDAGCRTDLFWTLVSFTPGSSGPPPTSDQYVINCKRLSVTGYGSSIQYIDSSGGITTYSADTVLIPGTQSDNLHGIQYKMQPYLKDIGDTTLGSFIGIVGSGSTVLSIVSQSSQELANSFEVGNLIICAKNGVFSGDSNKIVGFGTTTITGISTNIMSDVVGIASTSLNVSTIILQSPTVGFTSLPESDGSYVEFTVVADTQTFDENNPRFKYKIPFKKNPFSPETVGIMDVSSLGKGLSIEYDNSGNPSQSQTWKPELEGVEKNDVKIKPPKVGAGKIYNLEGFTSKPINPSTGNPVTEGTTITVSLLTGIYSPISPPAGCAALETNLTNAISTRNTAESSLTSGSNCIGNKINASNAIRRQISEYSLKIWGLRQSIGGESSRIDEYQSLETYINDTEGTIDQTGPTSCI